MLSFRLSFVSSRIHQKKKKFKQILDSIIEYFSNCISFFRSIIFLKSDSIFLQSNDFYKSIKTLPLFAYFRFLMIGWIVYILLYISLNSLPATMIITISKVCKESEYVKTLYHPDRKPLPTVSLVKENILVLHTGYKMAYIKFWSTFDKELCTVSNKISYIYIKFFLNNNTRKENPHFSSCINFPLNRLPSPRQNSNNFI